MEGSLIMTVYRNRNYVGRDYECTNIVACETMPDAPAPTHGWNGQPADYWDASPGRGLLVGLEQIGRCDGVTFWGYL